MTKARLFTLVGGVLALFLVFWWRVVPGAAPNASGKSPVSFSVQQKVADEAVQSFDGKTMGTTFSVKFVSTDPASIETVRKSVEKSLFLVDEEMSTYRKSSDVSRFNRSSGTLPFSVSRNILNVLIVSQKVHSETEGAFDITVRPLVRAYGFGEGAQKEPPSEQELAQLRSLVGMTLLTIDDKASTLRKADARIEIDLSGVAKGYGVDEAVRALEELGISSYLVEVGGELRFRGTKPGSGQERRAWNLAIEEPDPEARRIHGIIQAKVEGGALATSGDYRSFRTLDGKSISHTLDPRTGEPIARRTASVSVLRPTASEADALATALGVLTPERAIELAERYGWAVYLLLHQEGGGFESRSSKSFDALSFERISL